MLGAELDATILALVLLEVGFVGWLVLRARRAPGSRLVDDAVRLGLRSRHGRA